MADLPAPKNHLHLDLRWITLLLLAIIAGLLLVWKPWDQAASGRTVAVTGEATIKAEPDEFLFYPRYVFKNSNKTKALAAVARQSETVVAGLKKAGVADQAIKIDSSGYDFPSYSGGTSTPTYTLSLTVTVSSLSLAQKVQDYLLTTAPTGSVSPQATFSDDKRKTLESTARDQATADARAKAEQSAKNLGFKLGKVKTVADSNGFGGSVLYGLAQAAEDKATSSRLSVRPGENELRYTVTVTYFVR